MKRRNREEIQGDANYPLEQEAPAAAVKGQSKRFELSSGDISIRQGYGGAPLLNSKRSDYNNAKVGLDYDSIVSALNHPNPMRQEKMAQDILDMTQGKTPNLSQYTDAEKRGMSHVVGITQLAEQHPNRTPDSAALARGSPRRIADGTSTFHEEFNRVNGNYIPARQAVGSGKNKMPGGTKQMRDFVQGKRRYEEAEYTAANMSEGDCV